MSLAKFPSWLPFILVLAGCDLVSSQYPYGSTRYPPPQASVASGVQSSSAPQSLPQPPPPATGSQRRQHIWQRAVEGMVMGASLGGVYGAGGGLVLGLLTGLFTADAHYTHVNNQIQAEHAKDRELEAKLEQELQRQRELEAQIVNRAGNPTQQNPPEPPQAMQEPNGTNVTTATMKKDSGALASLSKKETPSSSPSSPFKNAEVRDINGDGIADLWIYYNPVKPGEIVRQEEATRWDGRVDTWSYFKDGKLVRREIDSKGRGVADTVYHYENDKIVSEERDENGTGHMSFRATYQNGRRAKLEKDTNGLGKIDHWIYYDTTKDGEIVLKEERDLNGDGVVDLWSYYENGRLARQDVSTVGAELLSKQDRFPSSPADTKNTPRPQLVR
jgi:antitoxin component YwqK of YwqJK toxin-antitoxin module